MYYFTLSELLGTQYITKGNYYSLFLRTQVDPSFNRQTPRYKRCQKTNKQEKEIMSRGVFWNKSMLPPLALAPPVFFYLRACTHTHTRPRNTCQNKLLFIFILHTQ